LISQYSNTVGDQGEFELLQESTRALEAQLLEERRLVAALEAELQRPVNVHKWRQLSDTRFVCVCLQLRMYQYLM
jgi:hypothetical protein